MLSCMCELERVTLRLRCANSKKPQKSRSGAQANQAVVCDAKAVAWVVSSVLQASFSSCRGCLSRCDLLLTRYHTLLSSERTPLNSAVISALSKCWNHSCQTACISDFSNKTVGLHDCDTRSTPASCSQSQRAPFLCL
jgi:hypothetical protein